MTVVLSSHLLPEVEELCNRVAIIRSGPDRLRGRDRRAQAHRRAGYRLRTTDDARALEVCRAQPGIADVHVESGEIHFTGDEAAVAELSVALIEAGALIRALAPETVTLEDLFFSLTEGAQEPAPAPEQAPLAPVRDAA